MPLFAALARSPGFPCGSGVPLREQVHRLRSNVTLFEDLPGVRGSGWPSGGSYPANGLVGIGEHGLVFRSTCTLPTSEHTVRMSRSPWNLVGPPGEFSQVGEAVTSCVVV